MATGMSKKREKRSQPRTQEQLSVSFSVEGSEFRAETKNLSASGTYCTLDRFVSPMTKLNLRFEIPNGKSKALIQCTGVVVRVEPVVMDLDKPRYHTALFFSDISDNDRAIIARFVQDRLSASPPTQ